jgi:MFS family permease
MIVLTGVREEPRPAGGKARGGTDDGFLAGFKAIAANSSVVLLLSISFLFQMANTTANPIMPLFLREIAAGQRYIGSATGMVLGLGAAAGALGSIISGKFCPRVGHWKTLAICLVGGCVGIMPQTFASSLWQLAAMHFVPSFFLGGIAPALQALLAVNTDSGHQGRVFGLNTSASSAGAAIGPLVGSAAAMISYRAVFPVTAILLSFPLIRLLRHRGEIRDKR